MRKYNNSAYLVLNENYNTKLIELSEITIDNSLEINDRSNCVCVKGEPYSITCHGIFSYKPLNISQFQKMLGYINAYNEIQCALNEYENEIQQLETYISVLKHDKKLMDAELQSKRSDLAEYSRWYKDMISHDKKAYNLWCSMMVQDPSFKYFEDVDNDIDNKEESE